MTIECDDVLGEAPGRAARLRSVVENLHATGPARAVGRDAIGAVRMVRGPDGLPVGIRPARRRVELGVALEGACAAASAPRSRTRSVIDPAARPREQERVPAASAGRVDPRRAVFGARLSEARAALARIG